MHADVTLALASGRHGLWSSGIVYKMVLVISLRLRPQDYVTIAGDAKRRQLLRWLEDFQPEGHQAEPCGRMTVIEDHQDPLLEQPPAFASQVDRVSGDTGVDAQGLSGASGLHQVTSAGWCSSCLHYSRVDIHRISSCMWFLPRVVGTDSLSSMLLGNGQLSQATPQFLQVHDHLCLCCLVVHDAHTNAKQSCRTQRFQLLGRRSQCIKNAEFFLRIC